MLLYLLPQFVVYEGTFKFVYILSGCTFRRGNPLVCLQKRGLREELVSLKFYSNTHACQSANLLNLCILETNSRRHFKICFLFFPRK